MNAPNPKSAYQATTQKTAHSDTPAILTPEALALTDAYWRAANYLSVGQIYPYDNPLLREPLTQAHVKPLVVGQWGTTRG